MWWRKPKKPVEPLPIPQKPVSRIQEALAQRPDPFFDVSPWVKAGDGVNGIDFAKKAKSHARYEVAIAFQRIGIDWYEKKVVGKKIASDSEETRAGFKQYLLDYKAELEEFQSLIALRSEIMGIVRDHPLGLPRKNLKLLLTSEGSAKIGVICNQLARGGWIRQEGEGMSTMLFPIVGPIETNASFAGREIPKPGSSGVWI